MALANINSWRWSNVTVHLATVDTRARIVHLVITGRTMVLMAVIVRPAIAMDMQTLVIVPQAFAPIVSTQHEAIIARNVWQATMAMPHMARPTIA